MFVDASQYSAILKAASNGLPVDQQKLQEALKWALAKLQELKVISEQSAMLNNPKDQST